MPYYKKYNVFAFEKKKTLSKAILKIQESTK